MQSINDFDFPEGIMLTGDGMMCAKEYRLVQETLHSGHVSSYYAELCVQRERAQEMRRIEKQKLEDEWTEYGLQFI